VRNRVAGFAKSVAMRALGTPHGVMYLKNIILVDEFVDPFNLEEVIWALSTRTRANDIMVLPNMAMVPIDPAAEVPGKGHRLIIDATSFMAPDNLGADPHLVSRPAGAEIDALLQRLKSMQVQGGEDE
jgi:3-polyprenyl-4-hydroxybenzoate decarboxylase